MTDFLIRRSGFSWTDIDAKNIKLSDLSPEAIDTFVRKGVASKRMSSAAIDSDHESLLRRYELINDDGITRAAAILFSKNPLKVTRAGVTKIGAFSEDERLLRDDRIEGPVVSQPDRVMEMLWEKYVQGTYDIEGLQRVMKYPYPEKALREAVMNSTVHRDYSEAMDTSIRVYPDRVEVFNPGRLPEGWTAEELSTKHESKPANPLIAHAFYDMGYVENWAAGIPMMRRECDAMGVPEPEFSVDADGIRITFRRAPEKKVRKPTDADIKDLEEAEFHTYHAICGDEGRTVDELSVVTGLSKATVKRAITSLTEKEMIRRIGSKKAGKWIPTK